jgi:hypothetical protein
MKINLALIVFLVSIAAIAGCGNSGGSDRRSPDIVVNSLEDLEIPPYGTVTLRSALASAESGQPIVFDSSLDGGVIELSVVGETHTILPGEVMGMRDEPSGPVSYLEGYFDRDYGKSALYAPKDVVIDASSLPSGITLAWSGAAGDQARILAVHGDLTLVNVSVTGGMSVTEDISKDNPEQPWTLARGGGVAVWGVAWLTDCTFYDNHCEGDFDASRDRGAFGGGIYANIVQMEDCIVSGNTVLGGGAAGGGVFSVGGAESEETTAIIERSSITGNRISGLFAYGGGVYSDGGGIGNSKTLELKNCTIARNKVDPPSVMPPFLLGMGYWRGGGVYISNGDLSIMSCTIVENEVHGMLRIDELDKPNLAGGIAATIGNAHAVEYMTIGHSVIADNTVHDLADGSNYSHDVFTGSLLYFRSLGYNRIGVLDFSHILVPVGEKDWASLCRKHFPKTGDEFGVDMGDVIAGVTFSESILSEGVDESAPVVLHYTPMGSALDQVPSASYSVYETFAEYTIESSVADNFLAIVLNRVEALYGLTDFAAEFTEDFETFLQTLDADDDTDGVQPYTDPLGNPILTLADTLWFGPAVTWPKNLSNYPYIEFWHRFDNALDTEDIPGMGPELLGDEAWGALFSSGALAEDGNIVMKVWTDLGAVVFPSEVDQLGSERRATAFSDIGAIEIP